MRPFARCARGVGFPRRKWSIQTDVSLLPVVNVAPSRVFGILRMFVTDHGPIQGVDDSVPVATQVGAHLEVRAPCATYDARKCARSASTTDNSIAWAQQRCDRDGKLPLYFSSLTPAPAGRDCGTESPRSRASVVSRPPPRGRRWCERS